MLNRYKQISAESFDFDGCLFHHRYRHNVEKIQNNKRMTHYNSKLLTFISEKAKANQAEEIVLLVGSNRQSHRVDKLNFKPGAASCFPEMQVLRNAVAAESQLPCRVDDYLLADSYSNKKCGFSFKKSLQADHDNIFYLNHPEFVFDDSKLNIVYAQIHKLAVENPSANIVYNFYENTKKILDGLGALFVSDPDLIPENVTAHFYFYDGNLNERPKYSIKGKGGVDKGYHRSVKIMAMLCGVDLRTFSRNHIQYNFIEVIDINAFKARRKVEKIEMALTLNEKPTLGEADIVFAELASMQTALDENEKIIAEVLTQICSKSDFKRHSIFAHAMETQISQSAANTIVDLATATKSL